jgi:hypothetical protein
VATLIGISRSLRRASYNTALLRAAARLMPDGTHFQIWILPGMASRRVTSSGIFADTDKRDHLRLVGNPDAKDGALAARRR